MNCVIRCASTCPRCSYSGYMEVHYGSDWHRHCSRCGFREDLGVFPESVDGNFCLNQSGESADVRIDWTSAIALTG